MAHGSEFVSTKITTPTDVIDLAIRNQKDAKARRIILDVVKDHVISPISKKNMAREMWEDLMKLYQAIMPIKRWC